MKNSHTLAKYLRYAARTALVIIVSFWFVFASLSGAEGYGGGVQGVLMNSPNALPWVLMFGLVYVCWKWELVGGILVVVAGLLTIFVFNTLSSWQTFSLISLSLTLTGIFLVISWYLDSKERVK